MLQSKYMKLNKWTEFIQETMESINTYYIIGTRQYIITDELGTIIFTHIVILYTHNNILDDSM